MALILYHARIPIVFMLSSFEHSPRNAVYQLYVIVISSSLVKRTLRCFNPPDHPSVTKMAVCGLVDVKLTLNLIDCWLNGKSLPLMSWCWRECALVEMASVLCG